MQSRVLPSTPTCGQACVDLRPLKCLVVGFFTSTCDAERVPRPLVKPPRSGVKLRGFCSLVATNFRPQSLTFYRLAAYQSRFKASTAKMVTPLYQVSSKVPADHPDALSKFALCAPLSQSHETGNLHILIMDLCESIPEAEDGRSLGSQWGGGTHHACSTSQR